MNRYRIWQSLAWLVLGGLVACKPLPSQQQAQPRVALQQSPNISRPLAPDQSAQLDRNLSGAIGPENADGNAPPPSKIVKVGLLLPLTGHNSALGKAMQDAATISLFDKYAGISLRLQGVRVELLPRDTGDTPQQAVAAMNRALADGAEFIIGPLFSDATEAIAGIARDKNISVLSLSSNRARADTNIYTFGFAPQEQARRIVSYALQHGKTRIALLVPDSALGAAVMNAASATIRAAGLTVAAQAQYMPQGAGLDKAMAQLIPGGTTPNFDALLIAESGQPLDTLLRALSARGVNNSNTQFLGTGLWDDATLLHRVNLTGAWLASSPPNLTAQFEDRFRVTYNYAPPRLSSLAYDAVALAVTLATSGRSFEAQNLTSNGGFSGPANGIFRLRSNGLVERNLAVMRVNGAALEVIDPAPVGFSAP